MFTVEIRINGSLIIHIYGRNYGKSPKGGSEYEYGYEYYSPELHKVVKGIILHDRDAGVNPLIGKILEDVRKKEAK